MEMIHSRTSSFKCKVDCHRTILISLSPTIIPYPNKSIHIAKRPSMPLPDRADSPVLNTMPLPISHPALFLPDNLINQPAQLLSSPRPQTTNDPVPGMHERQDRDAVRQRQMRDVVPEPEDSDQQQQQPLHGQHQDTPQRTVLQLEDHERVAVRQHVPQHLLRDAIVEVVETETEEMHHFRPRVCFCAFSLLHLR